MNLRLLCASDHAMPQRAVYLRCDQADADQARQHCPADRKPPARVLKAALHRASRFGFMALLLSATLPAAQAATPPSGPREVIIDTDIGTDIDDAFALALAVSSPELKIDLVMASSGDTAMRARVARRLLDVAGRPDIPVSVGPATHGEKLSQQSWGQKDSPEAAPYPDAVETALARLRSAPAGTITLIGIAPPSTIAAMIARDPGAFRRLHAVVLMAGSIRRGYGKTAGTNSAEPTLETNASIDPAGLRALLASGVPVEMMPLDATEVALDDAAAGKIFGAHTPLTEALQTLTRQWAATTLYGPVPTLFDVVPVTRLILPAVCSPVAMRLAISDKGDTTQVAGPANVSACLDVDRHAATRLLASRLTAGAAHTRAVGASRR